VSGGYWGSESGRCGKQRREVEWEIGIGRGGVGKGKK
jgi:hypothetical protein